MRTSQRINLDARVAPVLSSRASQLCMTIEDYTNRLLLMALDMPSPAPAPRPREGWEAAAMEMSRCGDDRLLIDGVLPDETMEDLAW